MELCNQTSAQALMLTMLFMSGDLARRRCHSAEARDALPASAEIPGQRAPLQLLVYLGHSCLVAFHTCSSPVPRPHRQGAEDCPVWRRESSPGLPLALSWKKLIRPTSKTTSKFESAKGRLSAVTAIEIGVHLPAPQIALAVGQHLRKQIESGERNAARQVLKVKTGAH
jgi:hypothetical protein